MFAEVKFICIVFCWFVLDKNKKNRNKNLKYILNSIKWKYVDIVSIFVCFPLKRVLDIEEISSVGFFPRNLDASWNKWMKVKQIEADFSFHFTLDSWYKA